MHPAIREFWLYPFDQADTSWFAQLGGRWEASQFRHPRVRGRINFELMKRLEIATALRPISDPLLYKLALLDAVATRRLSWLAGLCLVRPLLQKAIGQERRQWVREVVGEDIHFLTRRAALLWRGGAAQTMPIVSCSEDLRTALSTIGLDAFAAVLQDGRDPEVAGRLMLRFPMREASSAVPLDTCLPAESRRLFEKLVAL